MKITSKRPKRTNLNAWQKFSNGIKTWYSKKIDRHTARSVCIYPPGFEGLKTEYNDKWRVYLDDGKVSIFLGAYPSLKDAKIFCAERIVSNVRWSLSDV